MTSCGASGPDARVESCSRSVQIQGLAEANRYDDHRWIGVGFIGPVTVDPVQSVTTVGLGANLQLAPVDDIPSGPYSVIAEGTVESSKGTCRLNVKRLNKGLNPPAYLGIPRSRLPGIVSGQENVVVLMIGPGPD